MTQSQQNNFIITHIIYLPVLSRKSFKKSQEVQSPKYMYAPFMPEIFVAVVDELNNLAIIPGVPKKSRSNISALPFPSP